MNTLIIFVTGVAIGLVVDKVCRTLVCGSKQTTPCCEKTSETETTDTEVEVEVVEPDEEHIPAEADNEPVVEKTVEEQAETEDIRDDLSQLKGVGPKLADALNEIGIYNFEQLSSSSVDELLVRLRETGGRFSLAVISSVVERAGRAVNHGV